MAILYLLQRADVWIEAITVTGTGEVHYDPGVRNAASLVTLAGEQGIPITCGRERPLQGMHAFPDSWRESVDNLHGLALPEGTITASGQDAVGLINSTFQASPVPITLITLGPLTNLAQALQANPALAENLEMVYIMGGAVNVPGNVASSGVGIDNSTADVYDLLTTQLDFIESGGYFFWDPLTAAILTDESLAEFESRRLIVVDQEGLESGRTKPDENGALVRVAVSVEADHFEQAFIAALNASSP